MSADTIEAQRDEARAKGNERRFVHSRIKAEIREGKFTLAEVLEHPELHDMRISVALEAVPRLSPQKAGRMLVACFIPYARNIGKLSLTEKNRILDAA